MKWSPLAKIKPPRFIHGWIDAAEAEAKHVAAKAEDVGAEAIGYAELAGFRYPVQAYQFKVTDTLTRGSRLDEAGLADLKKRGFRGVVNLCKEYDDSAKVKAAGLIPLHLPILDNTAPPEGMMKQFLDFAQTPEHQPTYVHCEAGKGRTGCAVACYRMGVQGWTAEEAIADGEKFGLQLESQISWLSGKFYVDLRAGRLAPYPLGQDPIEEKPAGAAAPPEEAEPPPRKVSLTLQDDNGQPHADTPYTIEVGGQKIEGKTDKHGKLTAELPHHHLATVHLHTKSGRVSYHLSHKPAKPKSVQRAQQHLVALGYDLHATGHVDAMTAAAVRHFQSEDGLAETGELDDKTRDAIEKRFKAMQGK